MMAESPSDCLNQKGRGNSLRPGPPGPLARDLPDQLNNKGPNESKEETHAADPNER